MASEVFDRVPPTAEQAGPPAGPAAPESVAVPPAVTSPATPGQTTAAKAESAPAGAGIDTRAARFDRAHERWAAALQAGDERRAVAELAMMKQCLVYRWQSAALHREAMDTYAAAEKRHRGTWPLVPLVPADEARSSMWHG